MKKMDFREQKQTVILKKLNEFSFHSLVTLYKSSISPILDYADIIYEMLNIVNICNIKSVQHNAPLAITGAFTGTSKEKLYQNWALNI